MENYKLKTLREIGNIKVWEVDGSIIRKDIEPEFTNFAQHLDFDVIPKDEMWIDKEKTHNEVGFFVTHMVVERKLNDSGIEQKKAHDMALKAEKAERYKSSRFKDIVYEPSDKLDKIRKRLIAKVGGLEVWEVDGELVRDLLFEDFTQGGHDLVYSWIPKNNIWIDDDISSKEEDHVIFHEIFERCLMSEGWTYDDAHRMATEVEWIGRQ